ncbi:MAG TPA: hypothetical protein VGS07_21710 [Thermoanaerobaculia bacterium]|jgi:hypothetical protein|nr:hypothetical protein [Thermoanaerobaculia bacterium]
MSVAKILAKLEARAAAHREQQAFHAQKETHHREQRELHEAGLETVNANLETFRAAAATAVDLATQPAEESPSSTSLDIESGWGRLMVSRMIRVVVDSQVFGGEPFGGTDIAEEANKRFADRLHRPIDSRAAGDVLRRMRSEKRIHLLRAGKPFYEALYGMGARPVE